MPNMKYDRLADADPQTPIPEPGSYSQYSRSPRPTPADEAAAAVGRDDEHLREQLRAAAAREAQVAAEVSNIRQLLSESGSASPVLRVESVDETHTTQQPEPEPEPEPQPANAPLSPSVFVEEEDQLSRILTQLEQQKEGVAQEAEEELRRAQEELQSAEHRVQVELRSAHDRLLRAQMAASPVLALPEAEAPQPQQNYVGVPRAPAPETGNEEAGERDKRFATDLKERPYYQHMQQKREDLASQEGERAMKVKMRETAKQVGPLVETLEVVGRPRAMDAAIKYGEIRFEENDRVVPYLIIPERKRGGDVLLRAVKSLKHVEAGAPQGHPVPKPSILFDTCTEEGDLIEWAEEVYRSDALSEAWGWWQWTCACGEDNTTHDTECARCRKARGLTAEHGQAVDKPHKLEFHVAAAKFIEQMMCATKYALSSLEQSGAWLFTPAGRGREAQLCGETIQRFRGSLEDIVWMQYAALGNPRLFGVNHSLVIEQLRKSALPMVANRADGSMTIPDLRAARAFYPSQRVHYPSLADLHRVPDWVEDQRRQVMDLGIDIHPQVTHLIFFDVDGHHGSASDPSWHSSGFGAGLEPHGHISALKSAMQAEGVAEGMLMMGGDPRDLRRAQSIVSCLNPVVVFKSIGGASEVMARVFQKERKSRDKHKLEDMIREERQDVQLAEQALERCTQQAASLKTLQKSQYGTEYTAAELHAAEIAVERATQVLADQRQSLADMQTEQQGLRTEPAEPASDDSVERNGCGSDEYRPDEPYPMQAVLSSLHRRSVQNAFEVPDDYQTDGYQLPTEADEALTVVVDAIPRNREMDWQLQKQMAVLYERQQNIEEKRTLGFAAMEQQLLDVTWEHAGMYRRNGISQDRLAMWLDFLTNIFNVLIVTNVTVKQWFFVDQPFGRSDPTTTEEETVERSTLHVVLSTLLIVLPILNGLLITLKSQLDPHAKCSALEWADALLESETYKYRCRAVDYSASEGERSWSLMTHEQSAGSKGGEKRLAAIVYEERCKEVHGAVASDSTFSYSHMVAHADQGKIRVEREQRAGRKVVLMTGETIDARHGRAKQEWFEDDGYGRLVATQYLACRTQAQLDRLRSEVEPLSVKLRSLRILTLVATTISVLLGSINIDLFIAISTAAASFFTTVAEDGDYKRILHIKNISISRIEAAKQEWLGLTVIEKRDQRNKDRLVQETEAAIMAPFEISYPQAFKGNSLGKGDASGGPSDDQHDAPGTNKNE